MKKMTFILACLMMAALSANAQMSKVILQHQGNVTMYEPDDIQTAINDAQDGDTIFLNKGTFPGFTIDKKISVIGAGDSKTNVGSSTLGIKIEIPYDKNNQAQELTATMLEGLSINSTLSVTKAINGLKIKNCYFFNLSLDNDVKNVFMDRCKTKSSISLSRVVSLKAKNCIIPYLAGETSTSKVDDLEFINCYFSYQNAISNTKVKASFVNCWFKSVQYYSDNSTFYYCIVRTKITNDNEDYYRGSQTVSKGYDYDSDDDRRVVGQNYFGNDGTVVGPDGGTTPYTLTTTAPKILDESSAVVSTDMKALNVNIKVTPN
ncbi:MAG: hypothetical protein IJK87_12610 [Prevotella sp.]|nr:hypothetical protein [Prevotella sp.]